MGGALQLDPASSLYEFVQQRTYRQEFLGMKVRSVHLGCMADNLLGSSHGVFGCAISSVEIRNPYAIYISLFFVLTGLPVSPSLEVSGRIIKATASEGTEFAFVWTSVFIPANSFAKTEVLRGGLPCRVRMPLYLLRRVLTLAVKMVRTSGEFIFFSILNWW